MNKINERLEMIWNKSYMDNLPKEIKERGFTYCENIEQKDILIIGINPSYKKDDEHKPEFKFSEAITNIKHPYWKKVRNLLYSPESDINLFKKTGYIDLFSFRETKQEKLRKQLINNDGIQFLIDQISLTQEIIETVIQPKLIIVHNKEAGAYLGKYAKTKGWIWMGYEFEKYKPTQIQGKEIDLYKITGFTTDTKSERVYNAEKSNLVGSLIVFYGLYDERHKKRYPERILYLDDIEKLYNNVK